MTGPKLTRAERDDLVRVARLRAKVARSSIAAREAELLAEVEEQLSEAYRFDDDAWQDLTATAEDAVRRADAEVAARCAELGIPERFRPSLRVLWFGRGENASAERRTELRRRAQARIAANGKAAKLAIERREAEVLVELYADGLTSDAAAQWLQTIPTPVQLMPSVALAELENAPAAARTGRRSHIGLAAPSTTSGGAA